MSDAAAIRMAVKKLERQVNAALLAGVRSMTIASAELAELGESELHRSIDHIGTYKPYIDSSGNARVSSKPGEPPASAPGNPLDTNIYRRNVSSRGSNPAVSEFGVRGAIATELEFGTPKMQPRPFVRPARNYVASKAHRIIRIHFVRALRRSFAKSSATVVVVRL